MEDNAIQKIQNTIAQCEATENYRGYCFPEWSPNVFGGDKEPIHPWARIVHFKPSGERDVVLDFLKPEHSTPGLTKFVESRIFNACSR